MFYHLYVYTDSGSSAEEFLQGIFVFPESRVIHRGDMLITLHLVTMTYFACVNKLNVIS